MIEHMKQTIKNLIHSTLDMSDVVVGDSKKGDADLAIPLFGIAKDKKVSPLSVFEEIKPVLETYDYIQKIDFTNGFLNIYLDRMMVSKSVLNTIDQEGSHYGDLTVGLGDTVVMDYSSPNIAKSFSVGHLRSTVIGNALKLIYQKAGYKVVAVNHLGDWGTQFGKMIVAYQKWGNKEDIKKNPIAELQKLYVKFHDEEKNDPTLEQQARDVFRALELNDPNYQALWTYFKEASLEEFNDMYELLGVSFDYYTGESFYNDKMDAVVLELEEKNLLRIDEGATIVDLGADMPPALIKRSDGATLYMTRDVAALLYRHQTYHFKKMLYVVGNEQKLHFKQLKAVTDLMGYHFDLEHINFGLVLVDGKKMSTRGGKTTTLRAVIEQAIDICKKMIEEKNPNLDDKAYVAKAVGVGAIIFNDLKNEKHLDIDFNLENMLKFEGQTGPYIQYSSVRIKSMLREEDIKFADVTYEPFLEDHYFEIIKLLGQFPHIIMRALEGNQPNIIARYLLNLAQSFNSFYGKERILVEDKDRLATNLFLIKGIQTILDEGLRLLGIQSLEKM
ncbi:MAG: arginine--tRNA ligase [Acholeplasmataceae bacterium]